MFQFITTNAGAFYTIFTLAALALFAMYGMLDKASRQRREENDKLNTSLINGFKDRVKQLEETLEKTVGELNTVKKNMVELMSKNETLADLVKGKSEIDVQWRAQAKVAIDATPTIVQLVTENNQLVKNLGQDVSRLLKIRRKRGDLDDKRTKKSVTVSVS